LILIGVLACSSNGSSSSDAAGGGDAQGAGASGAGTGGSGGMSGADSGAAGADSGATGGTSDDAPFAARREACEFKAGEMPGDTFGPSIADANIPIDTFVLVVQENRSFDHYFSGLPAAGQSDVDVAAPNATNPDANGNPVSRFHQTDYCFADTDHSWNAMHIAYDNGKNDGFVIANDPNGSRALGYFDQSDLPFYYGLALKFGVGDRYFCPALTQTGPNRLYLYGATSLGTISNVGGPPGFVSIFDVLNQAGISWAVYRNADYSYEQSIFPAQYQVHPENFKSLTDFANDAAADKLPAVVFTYVGPDEHPPQDMQDGEVDVQKDIYNPLAASPAWQHSLFILTYDENGGIYDHVPPPKACPPDDIPPKLASGDQPGGFDRYGFRVPFVMASAWSKPHYVSHTVFDHTSILRLIELKYNLPALTARDANSNSLIAFFDFSQMSFPTAPTFPTAAPASGTCP
jgi:phospholipase C